MAEACDVSIGRYDLKLGDTFDSQFVDPQFHTLRYDFKPKSLACEKEMYIGLGNGGDVQIGVENDDCSLTVYKGSQKPVKACKECLLVFDRNSVEFRLEKLSTVISVKKTRDTSESDTSALKVAIDKLRQKNKFSSLNADAAENSQMQSVSSSSSCSSGTSDSESDNSNHELCDLSGHVGSSGSRSSGASSCGDDDEEDALENAMGEFSSLEKQGSEAIDNASRNLAPYSPNNHTVEKILHDDLQLSESSDED